MRHLFFSTGTVRTTFLLTIIMALLPVGCTVGPDYVRPDIPVNREWNTKLSKDSGSREVPAEDLALWWNQLGDPQLSRLLERAVNGNLDLKKAQARIREARARRGLARADLLPTINASGSVVWSKTSENAGGSTGELYSAGFDAVWELDIFGGVRRSVEAAQANLEASAEDRRDVLISLLSEVAVNYADVRIYQARLAVAESNWTSQKETCQITLWRREAGLSDELAVSQARLNLEATGSKIPALRAGLEEAMNRIAVLTGEQPGKVHDELKDPKPIPVALQKIAVGVPADILRRRPDVRRAERDLASQTAKVGAATADLYPKFKIEGTLGLNTLSVGSLFSAGSAAYSFGPNITIPVFAGGSIRQNIAVQSALQEQYLVAYETSILNALEEVENALAAFGEEQSRRKSLAGAAEAAREAARLAKLKYESGLTDFTTVLDAERSLLSAQDELTQSEGQVTVNLIRLYKALGGGWSTDAADMKKE